MMNHPLFHFNSDRSAELDTVYGIIGRALCVASRFERNCKTMGGLVQMNNSGDLMTDEQSLGELCHRMQGRTLYQYVEGFEADLNSPNDLIRVLYRAKNSRNYVAHELAPDFDAITSVSPVEALQLISDDLRPHVAAMARGDCLVLYATCVLSKQRIPSGQSLGAYVDDVIAWVCGCKS